MLAGKADLTKLKYPIWVSPKLDGIRAVVLPDADGKLVVRSRSMKPIPNSHIQATLASPSFLWLDGELIVGHPSAPDCYRKSDSGVMSHNKESDWKFYVFDHVEHQNIPFKDRFHRAHNHLKSLYTEYDEPRRFQIVPHQRIENDEELLRYETRMIDQGYEGIMIRSIEGRYKQGRSTTNEGILLKLKRWTDSEAEIIGFEEEMENTNESYTNEVGRTSRSTNQSGLKGKNRLGNLLVRNLADGVVFSVGSGLRDEDKTNIWNDQIGWLGRIIKYKHFEVGVKDKPRFPVFLGVRNERDM